MTTSSTVGHKYVNTLAGNTPAKRPFPVERATDGGAYARFGLGHLLTGVVASLGLSLLARNGGVPGITLGAAVVALPAVFVASYGVVLFRDLGDGTSERDVDPDVEPESGVEP
ncbi:MAG: hypothetical protein V5A28_04925 [Haloarculaceae archaeon]